MIKPEDIKITERHTPEGDIKIQASLGIEATRDVSVNALKMFPRHREDIISEDKQRVHSEIWHKLYGDLHRPIKELLSIAYECERFDAREQVQALQDRIFGMIGYPQLPKEKK